MNNSRTGCLFPRVVYVAVLVLHYTLLTLRKRATTRSPLKPGYCNISFTRLPGNVIQTIDIPKAYNYIHKILSLDCIV